MATILFTWWFQSKGVSLAPLPTALLALPEGVAVTALLVLGTDKLIYAFHREQRAKPVVLVIVSLGVEFVQGWNAALGIFNMGLISVIMALGVNMQWGYAGLFNIGLMGFVALGGLAAVLVGMDPVPEAWAAGGLRVLLALAIGAGSIIAAVLVWGRMPRGWMRGRVLPALLIVAFVVYRTVFDPAVEAIRANEVTGLCHGQECHQSAFADLRSGLGGLRTGVCDDDHAGRAVDAGHLSAAALDVSDLDDGDCGRGGQ